VCACVRVCVAESAGCHYGSASSARLHEAGYDSFITGLSFIAMTHYLGTVVLELSALAYR